MKGCLVRVGIDQTCGGLNSPIESNSGDYLYIPIPQGESECIEGLETPYRMIREHLDAWNKKHGANVSLPEDLWSGNMHLDPDFDYLSYGDQSTGRGVNLSKLGIGDFIAFYASFRDINKNILIYSLFGIYYIKEIKKVSDFSNKDNKEQLSSNAHLRLLSPRESDIIFFADEQRSGRFSKAIRIGGIKDDGIYRVDTEILDAWGDIDVKNGYIQRSVNPPFFTDPERFISWLETMMSNEKIQILKNNWMS